MASTAPVGILLTNLGTPDAPEPAALRRYLKEFLWDPRVVDMPRPLWWLILNGVILNIRPTKSAALYRKIWTADGSPLLVIGRRQQQGLQQHLDTTHPGGFRVVLAMRYGSPSIPAGLAELEQAGCKRVLVLPLYPQYSSSSSASTVDGVAAALKCGRNMPELRFVRDFHDDPAFIAALAASIREDFEANGKPEKLLFSFHGIPDRFHRTGDPYPDECRETAGLLAAELGLSESEWMLTFQSRFGREPWLTPYTDKTLESFPSEGVKSVAVACPGFSADCLETLEEIAMQNRKVFESAGGESYRYIPALNDRPDHIATLAGIALKHCSGWL